MISNEQCSTLYLRNLDERLSVNTLKRLIIEKLRSYGQIIYLDDNHQHNKNNEKTGEKTKSDNDTYNILSITARKTLKMKGQAFVAFETSEECQRLYKKLKAVKDEHQELKILDKSVDVQLARSDSDCVMKKKLKNDEEFDDYFQNRILVKKQKQKEREQLQKKRKLGEGEQEQEEQSSKKQKNESVSSSVQAAESAPPNKVLLIQKLPDGISVAELEEAFNKFEGFLEVRLVSARNLCFVEYENMIYAIKVQETTKGKMELNNTVISIDYAR